MKKNILLKVEEEEHELLKQRAKERRQSLNNYVLSKALDENESLRGEIQELKHRIETLNKAPSGI